MQRVNHLSTIGPDAVRDRILARLRDATSRSQPKDFLLAVIVDTQLMMESLPLASGEYAVASNRLRNARRYLQSDERGAAAYELRLLMGDLKEATVAKQNGRKLRKSPKDVAGIRPLLRRDR